MQFFLGQIPSILKKIEKEEEIDKIILQFCN